MKVAIVLLALVACSFAVNIQQEFSEWMSAHGKSYTGAEYSRRLMAYKMSSVRVARENAAAKAAGLNTVFAVNKFSDMTPAEFKAQYLTGYLKTDITAAAGATPVVIDVDAKTLADIPASFNWVDQNKTTPVKDQEQCGSCWAFSATEGVESAWLMANNSQIVLSPQQIVSCDTVDQGCNGGDLPTAFAYVKSKGLEDNKDYPYTSGGGDTGVCKFKEADVKVHISGFKYAVNNGTVHDDVLAIGSYANGPLSICVDASSWQDYSSGVLKRNCGTELDHCVQLTGWGVTGSTEYWIVRNSWNTDWGLEGFIWIERNSGKDLCGITEEATWVTL
jgi:C1A family cysteine protease